MNVSSKVLYGGALAVGVAAGAASQLMFQGGDDRRAAAHEKRLDGMSPTQLRDALRQGVHPPKSHALIAGATLSGGLVALGLSYGIIGGIADFIGGGPMIGSELIGLRPAGVMLFGGFGAMLGASGAALIHHVKKN